MLSITARLNFARTLGSTVMLGIMLFLSVPAATYAVANAPIAKNDAATTALDTRVRINVIANDRDRDGRIFRPKHGQNRHETQAW